MKKIISFFLVLFLCYSAKAQTIHYLIFADIDDPSLGGPTQETLAQLDRLSDIISTNTGLKKNYRVFTRQNFNAKKLDEIVENFKIESPKDIIFFYFIGHGWNNSLTESPMLYMGKDNPSEQNSRNIEVIYQALKSKSARLTITFAEACNRQKADRTKAKTSNTQQGMPPPTFNPEQLKNLFLRNKSSILLYTCKRNQQSFSDNYGGWFSVSFREALFEMTAGGVKNEATWESLLDKATKSTAQLAFENGVEQNPVFKIEDKVQTETPETPNPKGGQAINEPAQKTPVQTGKPANEPTCLVNRTAFSILKENNHYIQNYWIRVIQMERDDASEEFVKYFTNETKEYFKDITKRLNLIPYYSPEEIKKINAYGDEIVDSFEDIIYHKDDPQFRQNAYSKLSIPIESLKALIKKTEEVIQKCKEY